MEDLRRMAPAATGLAGFTHCGTGGPGAFQSTITQKEEPAYID
jgi:hypothetical protein